MIKRWLWHYNGTPMDTIHKSSAYMHEWLWQHKEAMAVLIIAIHLYVDWYLGLAFSAQLLTLGMLYIIYTKRSAEQSWVKPRPFWLWLLFLALAIIPATQAISLKDSIYYYFNVIVNTLLSCWLGIAVVQDIASVRRLFKMLALFAALLAIHTIIQAKTGVLLFKTTRYDSSIDALLHFELGSTGIYRAEAFLLNPDSNGAFFAMMLLLPLGLFVDTASYRAKAFYLGEMVLMLLALLFTYSTGAWMAAAVGIFFFIIFAGRMRVRIQISLFILAVALAIVIGFPSQVRLLLQHASASDEWSLRIGVWQTGLRVIAAFPLIGIGLGRYIYIVRAQPYRVPAQFIPVYHPHNSYLELAALGGIPLALAFIALLILTFQHAIKNWILAHSDDRSLLGGGIAAAIALSFYSFSNAGWTLTPLLAIGWLILGGLASPALAKSQQSLEAEKQEEDTPDVEAEKQEEDILAADAGEEHEP